MTKPPKTVIRAAIYCRCSTDEQWQGKEFNTLESQTEICKYAIKMKAHDGWTLGQIFKDGGFSGGSIDRPNLRDMMNEIKAGRINAVVVYQLDRLTRSIADFYELWEIFKKHKVVFVSATESFSTDTPTGGLLLNLLLSFAQWERQLTCKRVSDKIAERSKRGYWNGGNPTYGYDYHKEQKMLVINKDEAEVVKSTYELISQGVTPKEIAKRLNKEGYVTKVREATNRSGKKIKVGGKKWGGQNITRMIRNPIHRGIIAHKGNEYKGRHEAIVSKRLWDKANRAIEEKVVEVVEKRQSNRHQTFLKGLLKCGHCGKHLVPKPSGKQDKNGNPSHYTTKIQVA